MKKVFVFLLVLMFLFGCLRDRTMIESEDCESYKSHFAKVNCYKYKAMYYGAFGEIGKGVETCKEIVPKDKGIIENYFSLTTYMDLAKYEDCVDKLAYFSGNETVCNELNREEVRNVIDDLDVIGRLLELGGERIKVGDVITNKVNRCKQKAVREEENINTFVEYFNQYLLGMG